MVGFCNGCGGECRVIPDGHDATLVSECCGELVFTDETFTHELTWGEYQEIMAENEADAANDRRWESEVDSAEYRGNDYGEDE